MRRKSDVYTTKDELNFLEGIGSYHLGKRDHLLKYRSSAISRRDWGNIDKETVLDFVDKKIRELELGRIE